MSTVLLPPDVNPIAVNKYINSHSRTVLLHLDIIRPFSLPTDAQASCFKNIKIYF
jgi:hypothetical protein